MGYTVYVHTCPNGKKYVGITKRECAERWGKDGNRYKTNLHFWNAICKYGWDKIKHEVLYSDLTKKEAEQKEQELIAKYKSNRCEFGYNQTAGGDGVREYRHTQETKQKISEKVKGKNHPLYGTHPKAETREKWSKQRKGKQTGKDNPMWGRRGIDAPAARKIVQVDEQGNIIREFDYINQAAQYYNISYSSISSVCSGRYKTAKGKYFRYKEDII